MFSCRSTFRAHGYTAFWPSHEAILSSIREQKKKEKVAPIFVNMKVAFVRLTINPAENGKCIPIPSTIQRYLFYITYLAWDRIWCFSRAKMPRGTVPSSDAILWCWILCFSCAVIPRRALSTGCCKSAAITEQSRCTVCASINICQS